MNSNSKRKIYIIVPVPDSGTHLRKIFSRLENFSKFSFKVVAVEGGSCGNTAKICEKYDRKIPSVHLQNPKSKKPGKLLKTGLRWVVENSAPEDVVVTVPGFCSFSPRDLIKMYEIIQYKDIAAGSRLTEKGMSFIKRIFSYGLNKIFSLLFAVREINDYTFGFNMYKLKIVKKYHQAMGKLPITVGGRPASSEMLLKLAYFGTSMEEIPVTLSCNRNFFKYFTESLEKVGHYIYLIIYLKINLKFIVQKAPGQILHIVNIPWYSGLARFALDMGSYPESFKKGALYSVVDNSILFKKAVKKNTVIGVPGRGALESVPGIFRLGRFSGRFNIEEIVAHTGSSFFMGIILGILRKIPVYRVYAQRGMVTDNFFNRIMHNRIARGIIVPTEKIKKKFLERKFNRKKIYYLPPVVKKKFSDKPVPSENKVGIVGRLDKVKGHRILFKALKIVKEKNINFKLEIVGQQEGVNWEVLKKEAAELGILDRIKYIGYIRENKVPEFMNSCKLGVVPSLGSEAVSRVALEWMASGRPVVASSVGCLSEIIKNGYNGFLVEPGIKKELGEKIYRILNNRKLNVKMGKNAKNYIRKKHSPKVYTETIGKIFNE
ncbi:MAG: glycosyltransferase [Elusimicrobiota bacterium]